MEKMEVQSSSNSLRKTIRRRCHTRKNITQGSVINMAEARREIAHALHLHRSSFNSNVSTSSTSSSTSTKMPISHDVAHQNQKELAWNNTSIKPTVVMNAASYDCCYSLVEAAMPMPMPMPIPEPVWSTTAPTVTASPAGTLEAMEYLEWGENQASSYTWWIGFLQALDASNNNNNNIEKTKQLMEQHDLISSKLGVVEPNDQNACLDEWLMFPTTTQDDCW